MYQQKEADMMIEPIEVPPDISDLSQDGSFEGYAAIFNVEDMARDIIAPGAFTKSLNEKGVQGIKMLYQHDAGAPIGVWDELIEDEIGLLARGRLLLDLDKGREVSHLLKSGALDGLSIGFHTVKGQTDPNTGTRILYEIDLWEISVVTFPMHPHARVASVKSNLPLTALLWQAAHRLYKDVNKSF